MADALSMWVVCDHPSDYPEGFSARLWEIRAGTYEPTETVIGCRELAPLRDYFEKRGLTPLPREPGDDPVIVESWI